MVESLNAVAPFTTIKPFKFRFVVDVIWEQGTLVEFVAQVVSLSTEAHDTIVRNYYCLLLSFVIKYGV